MMASIIMLVAFGIQIAIAFCDEDVALSALTTAFKHHSAKFEMLTEKFEDSMRRESEFALKFMDLEKRVEHLEETNNLLIKENGKLKTMLAGKNDKHKQGGMKENEEDTLEHKSAKKEGPINTDIHRHKKDLENGNHVSFSAYMDHDADNLGDGQTIVFNQVLLNDGNGYNQNSGIFTAPIAGVYSFTFFIGERDVGNGIWADLRVNNVNKIDAAVDTYHDSQDLQGGNTVNLKLNTNDIVYIVHHGTGHADGADDHRVTSFSGFLIYTSINNGNIIG